MSDPEFQRLKADCEKGLKEYYALCQEHDIHFELPGWVYELIKDAEEYQSSLLKETPE